MAKVMLILPYDLTHERPPSHLVTGVIILLLCHCFPYVLEVRACIAVLSVFTVLEQDWARSGLMKLVDGFFPFLLSCCVVLYWNMVRTNVALFLRARTAHV